MVGEGELPEQWDDELPPWPSGDDRSRGRVLRRTAFFTTVGVLVTLIIVTWLFVGKDTNLSSRVSANETTQTTPLTAGFATTLPVAATATSFATTTSTASTTTTTEPTTTTSTTATTAPPAFRFSGPKQGHGEFTPPPDPVCVSNSDTFQFDTPVPGRLTITHVQTKATGSGPINPDGTFGTIVATDPGKTVTEQFAGTANQTQLVGTFSTSQCVGQIFNVTFSYF